MATRAVRGLGTATQRAVAVPRMWHLVDAKHQIVGRLAQQLANLLVGKHKPTYVPHVDSGDWVVVINAEHLKFTGDKMKTKLYRWHTGWMGGLKELTARQVHERDPGRLLEAAVKGMMPPNDTRKERLRRLRIFPGAEHPFKHQIGTCTTYAPEYMTHSQPWKWEPPPVADTGGLVKNYFGNDVTDDASLRELGKKLVPQSKEEALQAFQRAMARQEGKVGAWREQREKRQQAAAAAGAGVTGAGKPAQLR